MLVSSPRTRPFFVERSVCKNEFHQKPVSGFPTRIRAQVLESSHLAASIHFYRDLVKCHSPYLELFFFFFSFVSINISSIPLLRHRRYSFVRVRTHDHIYSLNEHFQRSVAIRETRSVRRPSQFRDHDTLDGGGLRENRV